MSKLIVLKNLNELKELQLLYRENYDQNIIGFHVLSNFIAWFERDPILKHITVYTFGEKWHKTGIYLIVDRYALFINSLIPADEELGRALKLLDWSRGYKITGLPESQFEIIAAALRELNIKWSQVKLHVCRLKKDKALQFEIPHFDEFELRPLDQSAVAIINSYWYSRQAGSLFFFERLIKFNLNFGVYRRDTQELIAWCTRCQIGLIGSIFVKEKYRNRGLAQLIIKAFSRHLAEISEDTYASPSVSNLISNTLFKKLGFEIITDIYHLIAYSVPSGMEWPLNDRLEN